VPPKGRRVNPTTVFLTHLSGGTMNTQAELTQFIEKELAKGRKTQIQPEDDLLSEGIIDSLGILQLVAFIEDRFGVQVADEDVVLENFQSVSALKRYLDTKVAA
jgi:acyl carrier protein